MLETYDQAGGGLVAGGLAYSALIALLPGLLLVLSVFGLVVTDPADPGAAGRRDRDRLPAARGRSRETALKQVSAGAVPERDHRARRPRCGGRAASTRRSTTRSRASSARTSTRNEIVRTLRGLLLTLLLVAFPIMIVFAGTVVQALLDLHPRRGHRGPGSRTWSSELATPVGTFAAVRGRDRDGLPVRAGGARARRARGGGRRSSSACCWPRSPRCSRSSRR